MYHITIIARCLETFSLARKLLGYGFEIVVLCPNVTPKKPGIFFARRQPKQFHSHIATIRNMGADIVEPSIITAADLMYYSKSSELMLITRGLLPHIGASTFMEVEKVMVLEILPGFSPKETAKYYAEKIIQCGQNSQDKEKNPYDETWARNVQTEIQRRINPYVLQLRASLS